MGPLNKLVKSNNDIHESNLKLIEITENIFEYIKDTRPCHECKCHMMDQDDEVLYKHDVMEKLKISSATYHRYKDEGVLVPMKIGRKDYFLKSSLNAFLADSKRKGR